MSLQNEESACRACGDFPLTTTQRLILDEFADPWLLFQRQFFPTFGCPWQLKPEKLEHLVKFTDKNLQNFKLFKVLSLSCWGWVSGVSFLITTPSELPYLSSFQSQLHDLDSSPVRYNSCTLFFARNKSDFYSVVVL